MRITPTLVLESVDQLTRERTVLRPEFIPATRALLREAVVFTWPTDVGNIGEHCAFAADLHQRGLFTLPYPVTAVSYQKDCGPELGLRGGMVLLSMDGDGLIASLSCVEVADGEKISAVPVGVALRVKVDSAGPGRGKIDGSSVENLVDERVARGIWGENWRDTMRDRLLGNTVNAMGMVVMLMSKGVSTVHTPPPDRLNKARLKKGKPPIGDRFEVRIDAGQQNLICHDDGSSSDITGHVRGTVRMHWRRGHFRTIHRGTELERVIPVAPSLIGANESAQPVRAKAYVVQQ